MSRFAKFLAASAAALALVGAAEARSDRYGCAGGNDRTLSTIAGAVIGGVIGGQFGNGGDDRALGAVAGAVLGGSIGNAAAGSDCRSDRRDAFAEAGYGPRDARRYDDRYEDRYDDRYDSRSDRSYDDDYDTQEAYYYDAFENADPYERVTWNSGRYANYVEAGDWYNDDNGRDCREFEQAIYVDGRRQTATGTACREADGTWRIVE